MSVKAKFFVTEVAHNASGGSVKLQVVCRGADNKEWSKYTPTGNLTMGILNDAALAQFVPGEEMYVTFTPAPKNQEGMDLS